ncbi:MAG: aspartate--tRNA ligase, partial [Planctomycetota bacterium]
HGGIFFVDLRDRYGITQITVDPEDGCKTLLEQAGNLKAEDVISVSGVVRGRSPDQINPNRITGAIEVVAERIEILSRSLIPPFEILDNLEPSLDLRLRYRYLDLRRRPMLEALELRSRFVHAMRSLLVSRDFIEVETPILTRATPEGARDYLVPSRVQRGKFYALPQSPQIFKQILMVAGTDKYFQIARCFRDEDLRADRQPEFTQLDLEMSFVTEDDVLEAMEATVAHAFDKCLGVALERPFPRLRYVDAMERYGSDKPDLRFGLELLDVSGETRSSDFRVFRAAIEAGGVVKAIRVPGGSEISRKRIDALEVLAREHGAKGLAWMKISSEGRSGPVAKYFGGEDGLVEKLGAGAEDLVLFAADRREIVNRALGEVRLGLARELGLLDPKQFSFCWIREFPLFEWSEERQRFEPSHHPFTAPLDWDADFTKDPGSIASRAYDLVLNGWELGSGSIRIHRQDVQKRLFRFLGLGEQEVERRFGFLIEALRYGAPPHGGFGMGLDRILALALGRSVIREVIAFPKTASASCLMCEAPSEVPGELLGELGLLLGGEEAKKK